MRSHCKSQHKYDPMPYNLVNPQLNSRPKVSPPTPEKQIGLRIALGKLRNMVRDCYVLDQFAKGDTAIPGTIVPMLSVESAANYMLDNYLMVRKNEIAGISGHVCNNCLTFQFQYIKDIGYDLTAMEKHHCMPDAITRANGLEDRPYVQNSLNLQSIGHLEKLTNLVFGGEKYVIVSKTGFPIIESNSSNTQQFKIENFHMPVLRLDTLTSNNWAWPAIHHGALPLDGAGLRNILRHVRGTYAAILVKEGKYSGRHLLSVSNQQEYLNHLQIIEPQAPY